jgi:hypothetical protein
MKKTSTVIINSRRRNSYVNKMEITRWSSPTNELQIANQRRVWSLPSNLISTPLTGKAAPGVTKIRWSTVTTTVMLTGTSEAEVRVLDEALNRGFPYAANERPEGDSVGR